jgi:HSP20 family protein
MNEIKNKAEKNVPADAIEKPKAKEETKLAPLFVEAEKMFEKMAEVTRETAIRAFDFFRQRGGDFGKELEDWFKAESEILRPVPVEISELDNDLFVKAAVPGFMPNEIEVSVKDNTLFISGASESGEKKETGNVIHTEWKSNKFMRQIPLPSAVDANNVKAVLKDGILELTLPKAAQEEAKKIAVAAG